jgi:hypothetical protein
MDSYGIAFGNYFNYSPKATPQLSIVNCQLSISTPPVECGKNCVDNFKPQTALHTPCGKVILFPTRAVDKKFLRL